MKILIKSTKNLSNYYVHAYETWKIALSKFCNVYYYGDGYNNFMGWDVEDSVIYNKLGIQPDIELWCGGPGNKKPQYINSQHILKNPNKNIPKLILITDYWEAVRDCPLSKWKEREKELQNMGVIGYFSFYSQARDWYKNVVNTIMPHFICFPYVYDDNFMLFNNLERKWDLNNQGQASGSYPFRQYIRNILPNTKINYFIEEGNHHYKILNKESDPLEKYFHGGTPVSNFAKLLNSCWITMTCGYTKYTHNKNNLKLADEDLFLAKYPQTLASNSVLFCPPITSNHIQPIIDGKHYISIDKNNVLDKFKYYLKNKNELIIIANAAKIWVKDNCSSNIVGNRFKCDLEKIIK
jgi:hypothetical protein